MKHVPFRLLLCLLMFGLAWPRARAAAATDTLIFSMLMADNASFTAQFKSILKGLPDPIKKRYGLNARLDFHNSKEDFVASLDVKPPPGLAFSVNFDDVAHMRRRGYKPVGIFSAWGIGKNPLCFYVPKSSKARTIDDLKGSRSAMYQAEWEYVVLRHWMKGQDPGQWFKSVKPLKNGMSGLLGVATGALESTVVYQSNEYLMKMSNPGALKKVRRVGCMDEGFGLTPPVFAHPNLPKKVIDALFDVFENGRKDPLFAHWHRVIKAYDIEFLPINNSLLQRRDELLALAREKKWEEQRHLWLSTRKK